MVLTYDPSSVAPCIHCGAAPVQLAQLLDGTSFILWACDRRKQSRTTLVRCPEDPKRKKRGGAE